MPYIDELFNMGDEEPAVLLTVPEREILCKFYDAYELSKINNSEFSSSQPEAHCKSSDLVGIVYGSLISIRGQSYLVKEIMPDGTGLTILKLTINS